MSARFLKKVLKEQEQLQQQNQHEEEEELNDSESPDKGGRSSINPFDLLDDGEYDHEDDEHEPDQGKESETADDTLTDKKDEEKHHLPKGNTQQSQKSKKKKKKKNKQGAPNPGKTEMPLDEALDTISLDINSSSFNAASEKEKSENARVRDNSVIKSAPLSVLQVDPKYLNVENELRRIFGSKVVRSFEKSSQSGSSRQVRGGRRGTHHIRKTVLISPSEHWPRWDGTFSMEFLETKDGYHYFRYIHSPSYEQAQRAFQAAQAIHDLNGVASVLLHHPYHLDSLITMADYFRFAGEQQMSADAIGKCLYALECAWHPMFTPFHGNCQLKFHHEANKPLFTTLFTHMRNMDRRGCHRSALEVCKLLLSLDSDDPVGALFCLDYFALRAEEYAWLEWFSEEFKSDNSLWLFPNFSYSLALCRLYLEREESSSQDTSKASSVDLMKQALMLYPTVLKKLVAKVPLKEQAWTKILQNAYFKSDRSKIPSLDHLINIYVERSYLIWRLPDNQKLLRKVAELVIGTLEHNESDAHDWACVRKETFSSDKNEYAHLSVQDFSDSVPTLPPDNLQNFVVDARMMNPGGRIRDEAGEQLGGGQAPPPPPHDVANRNLLAVLFESMLPWVHYGDAGDVAGADAEVNHQLDGHGQGNNEDH